MYQSGIILHTKHFVKLGICSQQSSGCCHPHSSQKYKVWQSMALMKLMHILACSIQHVLVGHLCALGQNVKAQY